MTRLTRERIEKALMAGEAISWKSIAGKSSTLRLRDATQRRLFEFLLLDPMRDPKLLSEDFVRGLYAAHAEPASKPKSLAGREYDDLSKTESSLPWKLHSIETEGFGGINIFRGPVFSHEFESESLLGDGENGSGKSSLIGAIVWAMTGKKPRDQAHDRPDQNEPVMNREDKVSGNWPPIAAYPPDPSELATPAQVRVKLTFRTSAGHDAQIERTLNSGQANLVRDKRINVPDIFVETGFLMPMRLAHLKFKEGVELSQVVQMLTGLSEMAAIGALAAELSHGGRKFLAYAKENELSMHRAKFDRALDDAASSLALAKKSLPRFTPRDANSRDGALGPIATSEAEISAQASNLTRTLADDLAPGLDVSDSTVQESIASSIRKVKERLTLGLQGIPTWTLLSKCHEHMSPRARNALEAAIETARAASKDALALHEQSQLDTRMQLKAVAVAWHQQHAQGPINECPLCERVLDANSALSADLKRIEALGAAAQQTLSANMLRIAQSLSDAVPQALESDWASLAALSPGHALDRDVRTLFVDDDELRKSLSKFVALADERLGDRPAGAEPIALTAATPDPVSRAAMTIDKAERVVAIARWFDDQRDSWLAWWNRFRGPDIAMAGEVVEEPLRPLANEGLLQHVERLVRAMAEAAPYREAGRELRIALKEGQEVARIEEVQATRDQIAAALMPLKDLIPLSDSVARETIEDLSEMTGQILGQLHTAERLPFRGTSLHKKEGVVVRTGFSPDVRIDATLIANTSWLRSVLWAFLFAMRAEAIGQYGYDPLPVMLFDDPQATFDRHHRKMWATYVASLQAGPYAMQVVMLSHDLGFLDAAAAMKVVGRRALLAPAVAPTLCMQVLEGDALERAWLVAERLKTSMAAWTYLGEARVFLEGMLKVMLQGEAPAVATETISQLRSRLKTLHASGRTPWERVDFEALLGALNGEGPLVDLLEKSHHTPRAELDFGDASAVHIWFKKKIIPRLEGCFRLSREWHGVHGATGGFHRDPPTSILPNGYEQLLHQASFSILGRASAFEGSSAADGRLVYSHIDGEAHEVVRLADHWIYRLTARTMEPVASVGDLLLVKQHGTPSPRSLVVARWENRVLARRLEISDSRPDVAVLTAQCVDPLAIAAPLVALRGSLDLHEVVGVIFDNRSSLAPSGANDEVCDCGGEARLGLQLPRSIGLAEVSGDSAQPLVLDGQYLFIGQACSLGELGRLDGRPVIAIDNDDASYFKRLRLVGGNQVVLESLDASGVFSPVVLSLSDSAGRSKALSMVYPVLGALFSR